MSLTGIERSIPDHIDMHTELEVAKRSESLKGKSTEDGLKLIYEWVKTGTINFRVYKELLAKVIFTDICS